MDYQLGPGPLQVDQNTIDEKIKGDIGIVENGDVATHAIPSGYYVIWKGDLYVAKTDISSGTTLSTSNLTAKPNGLGAEVAVLNSKITPSGLKNGNIDTYFDQDICWIQSANSSGSQPGFNYYQLEIIPNGNGQVVQRATEMGNSRIANRLYANGAWSPWEPVALSREITALTSNFQNKVRFTFVDIPSGAMSATNNPLAVADKAVQTGGFEVIYVKVSNNAGYEDSAPLSYTMYEIRHTNDIVTVNAIAYNIGQVKINYRSRAGSWGGWKTIAAS